MKHPQLFFIYIFVFCFYSKANAQQPDRQILCHASEIPGEPLYLLKVGKKTI